MRKHVGGELMTVDDYRNRYAQYRSDPALRAAHASFPFLVVWDDHEVDNNYAGLYQEAGAPVEQFALRRAAGYKAFYEHMPLRRGSIPKGALLQLYRPFTYGTLASISMLDTRQYRTDQPCGDNVQLPCAATLDPRATMLGAAQEKWLMDRLDRSRADGTSWPSRFRWPSSIALPGLSAGTRWTSGTATSRAGARLLKFLGTRKPSNPVTLAGDVHNNWVNDLRLNVDDPKTPVVASEFVGTSITSTGDGSDMSPLMKAMVSENECVRFANDQRGYVRFDLKPKELRADFRVVEYVTKPGAPVRTRASFVVEDGRPGAKQTVARSDPILRRAYRAQRADRHADTSSPHCRDRLPSYEGRRVSTSPSGPQSPAQSNALRSNCPSRLPTSHAKQVKVFEAQPALRAWLGILRESCFSEKWPFLHSVSPCARQFRERFRSILIEVTAWWS